MKCILSEVYSWSSKWIFKRTRCLFDSTWNLSRNALAENMHWCTDVWLWIAQVFQTPVKHLHKSLVPQYSCQIMQTHLPSRLIPQGILAFFYTFECLSRSAWNYTSNWHAFTLPTGKDAFPLLGTLINWKLRQRLNTLQLSESWIQCRTSTASNEPEGLQYHSVH